MGAPLWLVGGFFGYLAVCIVALAPFRKAKRADARAARDLEARRGYYAGPEAEAA